MGYFFVDVTKQELRGAETNALISTTLSLANLSYHRQIRRPPTKTDAAPRNSSSL
jgi:hypothetical protein